MTTRGRIAIACAAAGTSLAAAAAAPASPTAVGCTAEAGKQIAVAGSFRFTLLVGDVENMYMPRQVRATHPKHGEVMLRGQMAGPALLTGGPVRHLEVQICARTTNAVVTDADPTIVVADTTARRTVKLPLAVMEGIGEGASDLHYGNNLAMPVGHRFAIAVTWRRAHVQFRVVAPR